MMTTDSNDCGNCKFWKITSEAEEAMGGECRVRSPRIILAHLEPGSGASIDGLLMGYWPNTGETDWCGEHSPDVGP